MWDWLVQQDGLIAHNAMFETAVIYAVTGKLIKPYMCTRAMWHHLANEGYLGQSWSLNYACLELLQWPAYWKPLDAWLKANKLTKGDMCKGPWDIVGHYNGLDTAATLEIALRLKEVYDTFPGLLRYHQEEVLNMTRWMVVAQVKGIKINTEQLERFKTQTAAELATALARFLEHPDVAPHVVAYNRAVLDKYMLPKAQGGGRPDKTHKLNGEPTAHYQRWRDRVPEVEATNYFNTNSPQQLAWLFYDCIKAKVEVYTDTGAPSTDKKALRLLGRVGGLLLEYREVNTLMKFLMSLTNSLRDGRVHLANKYPGTITGRAASGQLEQE